MKFIRREATRYKKLSKKWRRPRGMSNKVRRGFSGRPPMPSIGYGNMNSKKGLHPSGLRENLVSNPADLEGLDPGVYAARISATVGKRKKEQILKKADEMKIKVLNR